MPTNFGKLSSGHRAGTGQFSFQSQRKAVTQRLLKVFLTCYCPVQGFLGGASGRESACQCRRLKIHGFDPWVGKIPWRRTWQPTLIFLPGEFHGQRTFWATAHGVTKTGIALKCPSMHARRVQCILFLSNAPIIVETYHPLVPFALYFLNVFNDITSIVSF